MDNELPVEEKKREEQDIHSECDRRRVFSTLSLMEKGTKQAFLDNELGIEETKGILDEIRHAKEACQTGDENACIVLDSLMSKLTNS